MIDPTISTRVAHTKRVIDESRHRISKAYTYWVQDRNSFDSSERRISEAEALLVQVKRLKRTTRTVLIVEDNELNMKLFSDLLKANGYTTLQARNGLEALRIVRQHRPDLILLDIGLPDISGLKVAEQLKADDELRDIPVVAVTAFAMPGDEEKIRQAGCDGYLAKPISITGLMQVVEATAA